jgi:hypothetical protein
MTITEAAEPATVVIDLVFEKPFKARNDTSFSITPEGEGSVVRWVMSGRKTFATRVMSVFKSMDALIGPDFERGLDRLKTVAESRSDT